MFCLRLTSHYILFFHFYILIITGGAYLQPEKILKAWFGYDSFRPGQREVVDTILSGRDCLAILPTGAGKSVCFQVPALMQTGLTYVISPLISLMEDQVAHLQANNIPAVCINSGMSKHTYNEVMYDIHTGVYKLLYLSPERPLCLKESAGFCGSG